MPMNPRLLRPTSSTLDADAAVYLNAVAQADGQQLEPAVRKAINDFVVGCKRDGIWDTIKASCILAGARTLAGALVPLVGTAPTNNNFTASDYNRETGLVGDGSTTYLDTNRANDDDPQDDKHIAVYVQAAHTSTASGTGSFPAYIGIAAGSEGAFFSRNANNSANAVARFNSTGTQVVSGAGAATGFVGLARSVSTTYTVRHGGANVDLAVASTTPLSADIEVLRAGDPAFASNGRIQFYSAGESLDLAALDTRVSALITAIGNAI